MDKETYYLVMKMEKILTFMTIWVKVEYIMVNEIGQKKKGKYCMISLIYEI